jgi:hypothetical protein
MPQKLFYLPNVFDAEDARIVENALRQINGVQKVSFQPDTKLVMLQWTPSTNWEEIEHKLNSLGYPVSLE